MTHDKYWDALELFDDDDRICWQCKSVDVKFGMHDREFRGFDISAQCNNCHASGSALVEDSIEFLKIWHKSS